MSLYRIVIFVLVIIVSISSCKNDLIVTSNGIILESEMMPLDDAYTIDIEAIPLKSELFLPSDYDIGHITNTRIILASISDEVVDIFERSTGKLIKRLLAEFDGDPFSFSRPLIVSVVNRPNQECILQVVDAFSYRTYNYTLEGEYLGLYESGVFFNDVTSLNDSINVLSIYKTRNAHASSDSLYLGGADFLFTRNGRPIKAIGQNPLEIDHFPDFYHQKRFFEWGDSIGYYNSFLDSIFIIDQGLNKSSFFVDFGEVGKFANLYKSIEVQDKAEYAEANNFIYIHDASYDQDILTIRYYRNGTLYIYCYDLKEKKTIVHSNKISQKGFRDFGVNSKITLGYNEFGGIHHYYDLQELMITVEGLGVELKRQAENFVKMSGIENIKGELFDNSDSLHIKNPIFYISSIKRKADL